jgi:hypothetical protein
MLASRLPNARLNWALHYSQQKRTITRRFTHSRRNARLMVWLPH